MEKKQSSPKGRKRLLILIIVIVAVAVVFLLFYQMQKSIMGSVTEAPPEIFMLERTSMENKVTASGNFESIEPVTIGSNVQYGEVDFVYVSVGDRVYEGEVLAVLKTEDIRRNIADTRDSLSDSNRSESLSLSQAQRRVNEARDEYNINYNNNNNEVVWAQNLLNAAYDADVPVQTARAALGLANKALEDAIANGVSPLTPFEDDVANCTQALTQAEAVFYGTPDVVKMQTAINEAISRRDSTARMDSINIQNAQDQVDNLGGTSSSKKIRSELESLEEDLTNATIVSSISGIVTSVKTEAGQVVTGEMFEVENTESLQVTATVAEYDVIKVENGQVAHVSSNALGDQMFEAVVDYVSPIAADAQGNFEVRVKLTSPAGQLRPGMTATVEIVTASKNDVFAVPIDSVVTKPDGKKVVYAYEPNATIMPARQGAVEGEEGDVVPGESMDRAIPGGSDRVEVIVSNDMSIGSSFSRREIVVTTGMETDYYIEISSDELTEGLLLLADPEGKNVMPTDMTGAGIMGASMGGTSSQSVTVVDSRGTTGAVRID